MKTCCLVWEIPVIEGEHYNPIVNVIYMQKQRNFESTKSIFSG